MAEVRTVESTTPEPLRTPPASSISKVSSAPSTFSWPAQTPTSFWANNRPSAPMSSTAPLVPMVNRSMTAGAFSVVVPADIRLTS